MPAIAAAGPRERRLGRCGGDPLVIGRLCEPSSELHVAGQWYRTPALEDLLQVPAESVYDERLYRALDRLLAHKEAIERHLVRRLRELFDLEYELLLYDVTSICFEGLADSGVAQRGYSRDHRPDCVQVNIAAVITREDMPLGYEIFRGNTADVSTVEEIVLSMERRFGKAHRVWVMDRGMVSAQNIAWLNATGRRYVIGTPRSQLKRWAYPRGRGSEDLWRLGGQRKVPSMPLGGARGERAERFAARIEEGLRSLRRRIDKSQRRLDPKALERQIGRLLQRDAWAAARYAVSIEDDGMNGPACLREPTS